MTDRVSCADAESPANFLISITSYNEYSVYLNLYTAYSDPVGLHG